MINDTTLSVDVWDSVRAKLVGNLFVTNSSTGETTAASIENQYNDKRTTRPQIIIQNPVDDESSWYFSGKQGRKDIDVFIDCYSSSTLGVSQLKDQVNDLLKDDDIDGIELVGLQSDFAYTNPNELKYFIYNITATYIRE